MNNLQLKKSLIGLLAIVLFLATLATVIGVGAGNVALAADVNDDVIYYGEDVDYGSGIDNTQSEIEYINYASKQVTLKYINNSFPDYFNTNSALTNACANVAGANIVGYYDRFYEDLILDCTPGYVRNDIYYYYPITVSKSQKQAVIDTLYVNMLTNNPIAGTNQANYKSGLTQFFNDKGRSVTISSVMTNGSFDLNKADAQFNQGNPITLYMQGFNVTDITETSDTQTRLIKVMMNSNHIMVAYGYQKVDYYDANGNLINSRIYLLVSNGIQGLTDRYYVLNNNGILNDAEGVRVY